MEEDRLDAGWVDDEDSGDSAGTKEPERRARLAEPVDAPAQTIDARHRRGSLGPAPLAAPLGETASAAALQAHLAHLLDARRAGTMPTAHTDAAEQQLTPHEDIERQPDGIPHPVIGLTALVSVAIAALLIGIFRSDPALGVVAAVAIVMIAIPVLVWKLGAKAERDRDHEHPSR